MNKTKNLRSRILPLLFVPALAAFGQEPGDYRVEGQVADATVSGVIYMTDALTRETLASTEVSSTTPSTVTLPMARTVKPLRTSPWM